MHPPLGRHEGGIKELPMKGTDLKHMSRRELLELLIAQATENEKLKKELEQARAELRDRQLTVQNAGSLADVAMKLSGVLEAAQDTAQIYLENLRARSEQQDQAMQSIREEAHNKAKAVLKEALDYSKRVRQEADDYLQNAQAEADALRRRP